MQTGSRVRSFGVVACLLIGGAAALAQQVADLPAVRLESLDGQRDAALSLPVTRLDEGDPSADLDRVALGALTFAEPLAIRDVVSLLLRSTAFSLVFDPAVSGSFAGELTDLSLRQALEAVLSPAGLAYEQRGRVVHVFPRRVETRLFEISHLNVTRAWSRRTGAAAAGEAHGASEGLLSAATEADFFEQIAAGVSALTSPGGRSHLNRHAGLVQVTDYPDRLEQIALYIEAATLRAHRQVRLSVRVLEVALSGDAPIPWTALSGASGRPLDGAALRAADGDAVVRALQPFGTVRTVAAPVITASNNQPALLRIAGGAASVGHHLTLTITAQISADQLVHLLVAPTYVRGNEEAGVAELDTLLRVRTGETVVVSGLLREGEQSAAATGLAGLFGGTRREPQRHELLLLITPTILDAAGDLAAGARR